MKIKTILLLIGKSTYDSTLRFLQEMREAWRRMGLEVAELNSYNELQYQKVRRDILEGRQFDMVFSFNGMMLENPLINRIFQNGSPLYCTMLMDHPMIHHARLQSTYSNIFVFSPDYYHVQYLEQYYPNIRAEAFLPHGGCTARQIRPFSERDILLSFVGSYFNAEARRKEFASIGSNGQQLLEAMADCMKKEPGAPIESVLQQILQYNQIELSREEFADTLQKLRLADTYIRGYYREKVIQQLLDAGIAVDVYGRGWEQFTCRNREYLRIHPPCDFKRSLAVTANSKFSLNVMPWFKAGSHDRIFTAMGCGAVAVTDSSKYIEEIAGEGGILLYRLEQLEALPEKLRYLLEHEEEAEELAGRGREQFQKKHTWAERAEEVIVYAEQLLKEQESFSEAGQ